MARTGLFFRTRSAGRDHENDDRRRTAVRTTIEGALSDARRELAGLERRIADSRAAAVSLMDNSGDYGERSPEDESMIRDHEDEAARATQRLATLRGEIALFAGMLQTLDATP